MSATEIDRTLVRLAHEILERHNGIANVAFVGVCRRGAPLAERLARKIQDIEKVGPPVHALDVTFFRDDLSIAEMKPGARQGPSAYSVENRDVILVDDVLYTGRTTRAALDALLQHGRPRRVELCVLIDRGHRELPIQAHYVGRIVQTSDSEIIDVRLQEIDGEDRVILCERSA
jgi:pyrimidine operon attenuation protein/uracil phosphoribosyltransferase